MAEYIEREALLAQLEVRRDYLFVENGDYDHYTNGFDEAVCKVEDFPAADVAPVVHGEWIKPTKIGYRSFDIPHCSVCDGVPCGVDEYTKYCPNCGAKMYGGKSDGNGKV